MIMLNTPLIRMKKLLFLLNKQIVLFLFCSFLLPAKAQLDTSFIQHLNRENLVQEQMQYLLNHPTDSIFQTEWTKFQLQRGSDSDFLVAYQQAYVNGIQHPKIQQIASIRFLTADNASNWFQTYTSTDFLTREIQRVYFASLVPNAFQTHEIPLGLQPQFTDLQRIHSKKPWIASTLSGVVPGLGKLYIGNRKSFVNTLLFMSVMGFQTVESYRRVGIKHPVTLINAGFFATYYLSNIVGSFQQTKAKKKEFTRQFLIDAQQYYRFQYSLELY